MKKALYVFVLFLFANCSSVKRSEHILSKGDYDKSIRLSIKKIQKSRENKKDRQHILLLEDAFKKAVSSNLSRINFLKKENDPENAKEIFELYQKLEYRQNLIRPLLPLKGANFAIVDYTNEIISSKNKYATYLFNKGTEFINRETLLDARTSYGYFSKLKNLKPNYTNIDNLLDEAHYKGTDFVYVTLKNKSRQVIPKRLQKELLDFTTYKLDDFWTEYHGTQRKDVDYNFSVTLSFKDFLISPERVNEKEVKRTKRIKDGWKYQLDKNGNVKKDSLGNDIKVDAFKTIRARLTILNQFKSVLVGCDVLYFNIKENKRMHQFPLETEFIFENESAVFKGNKKALTKEDRRLLKNEYVDFPTNEQMILDAGFDLKKKFARILKRKSFR